jgi:PAS domain S-box-containing protein
MNDRGTADENFLTFIIEGSPYAQLLVNSAGGIVLVNAEAEKLFGYTRSELLEQTVETLVPERFRREHPGLRTAFVQEPSSRLMGVGRDLYGLRKDGSEVPVEIGLSQIKTSGGDAFTVVAITDISERKRAEAERILHFGTQQYAARLERLNAELRAAVRQKSEFIGTMTHELRTPLAAIIGASELLTRARLDDDEHYMLQTIAQAAETLLALVDNILDFSMIEAGTMSLQTAGFDLDVAIANVMKAIEAPAREKGLAVETSIETGIPRLSGDGGRLRQVLLNLLGNAVKFTERGSVTLRVAHGAVSAGKIDVRFEVADTGVGIDASSIQSLLEPFVQADGSTSRRYGGAGLGLSIAKRLVELMGGSLEVQSTAGAGATFRFTATFALEPA